MAGPVKEAKSTIPVHKATIKAALPTNSAELIVTPADKDRSGHLGNGDLPNSAIHRVEAKLSSTKTINTFADGQDMELGAKEISSQINTTNIFNSTQKENKIFFLEKCITNFTKIGQK